MATEVPHSTVASGAPACPAPNVLDAFANGQLDVTSLERLAKHIASCSTCEATLLELPGTDDFLATNFRQAPNEAAFDREPECQRLEALVCALAKQSAAQPSAELLRFVGSQFGKYLIQSKVGKGAMGIVFRAIDVHLNRTVALKMVLAGQDADPEDLARFKVEAVATARLRHVNVVEIYEANEQDGVPYFAMELVEGGTLAQCLKGRKFSEREAAQLVEALARGAHAAHQRGIVHRDLKPGNVLLTADGIPKIADFGLAKLLDSELVYTRTNTSMGTPSYMAPEQALGGAKDVGPSADVYALGVILYEMVCGRTPFQAENRNELIDLIQNREPPRPSLWQANIDPTLESIILRCLEKQPVRRYRTAETLADELNRWSRGEPTLARPLRWPGRLARQVRLHPRIVLAAVVLLAALGFLASTYVQSPERRREAALRRLVAGEPATLLERTGPPIWHRLSAGKTAAAVFADDDGLWSINTRTIALIELLPHVPVKAYRYSAEIWHEGSNVDGVVGLYFGHVAIPGKDGPVHYFLELSFADVETVPIKGLPLALRLRSFAETGGVGVDRNHALDLNVKRVLDAVKPDKQNRVWRKLVIEVSPKEIRVLEGAKTVGALPVDRLQTMERVFLKMNRLDQDAGAVFDLHGALGIYVYQGTAFCRSVTVEPIEPHSNVEEGR